MKKKKSYLLIFFSFAYFLIYFIFKTFTVDLFLNLKNAVIFSVNPEERKKIKRKMENEKMIEVLRERIRVLERIVYAMNEDAGYLRSDRGRADLSDLKKSVK